MSERQVIIYVWTAQSRDGKVVKADVERCRDILRDRFELEVDLSTQVKDLSKISDRPLKDELVRKATAYLHSQLAGEKKASVKWPLIAIDKFDYDALESLTKIPEDFEVQGAVQIERVEQKRAVGEYDNSYDENHVQSPRARSPAEGSESLRIVQPLPDMSPSPVAVVESSPALAEPSRPMSPREIDGGAREVSREGSGVFDGSTSKNGDDEWETHTVESNPLSGGLPVRREPSVAIDGGANNGDVGKNMNNASPLTTSFNNIQYQIDNGNAKEESMANTNASSSTGATNNPTANVSRSDSAKLTASSPRHSPPTPIKPTPLYYEYAVMRQNWYWAMNERVLRFTPDHIQRLDGAEVREVHAYKDIIRIEVSNVDKKKFVMWFEKNDTIANEHYYMRDEKEREQLLKVCVDFAKKQSTPHSIPIARVG